MSKFGPCWCCANYGIHRPAQVKAGLCNPCTKRGPKGCYTAHTREVTRQQPGNGR